jgi:hypothetical protein
MEKRLRCPPVPWVLLGSGPPGRAYDQLAAIFNYVEGLHGRREISDRNRDVGDFTKHLERQSHQLHRNNEV